MQVINHQQADFIACFRNQAPTERSHLQHHHIGLVIDTESPAEGAALLRQLAADPDFANLLPFLTALQAITAGSRARSLAEDPGMDYTKAAEVVLLIEALETEAGDEAIP